MNNVRGDIIHGGTLFTPTPGFGAGALSTIFPSSQKQEIVTVVMSESVESSDCEGSPNILPPTPPRHRGSSGAKRQLLPSFDPFSATSTSRLNKENRSVEVSNTISLHTGDSSNRLSDAVDGGQFFLLI